MSFLSLSMKRKCTTSSKILYVAYKNHKAIISKILVQDMANFLTANKMLVHVSENTAFLGSEFYMIQSAPEDVQCASFILEQWHLKIRIHSIIAA